MASNDSSRPSDSIEPPATHTEDPFYSPHDDFVYREQQRIMAEAANMDRNPALSADVEVEDSVDGEVPSSQLIAGDRLQIRTPAARVQPTGWQPPPPLRIPKDRDDEDEDGDSDDDGQLEKGRTVRPGQQRCCCCSMKMFVVVSFSVALVLTLIGFFLWPRLPGIQLDGIFDDPNGDHIFNLSTQGKYVWQMGATANISVNNPNYIPWRINRMDAVMKDLLTGQQVGSGKLVSYTLPGQSYVAVSVPIHAQYLTSNLTDPTLRHLVASCSGEHPALPVRWIMNFDIAGMNIFSTPSVELQGTWMCPPSVSVNDPLTAA